MNILETDPEQLEKDEEEIRAQAQVWKHMYGFAKTIMLRCMLQLGIPDIIHEHGPITLPQLAIKLPINFVSMDRFHHVMRYLVHMKLFTASTDEITKETKFGLTPASKILVKGLEKSLVPYVMLQTDPEEFSIWGHVIDSLDGMKAYWEATYGKSLYEKIEKEPDQNKMVNDAMRSHTMCMIKAIVSGFMRENVLEGVKSIVDVGGNTGATAKAIADSFPHVKCTVMDLSHVIGSVTMDTKVHFVVGDMFMSVPSADAVLMKSTLHNYEDTDCLKILNKCKKALPSKGGKLILIEIVVDAENLPEFSSARLSMEMEMMLMGGKERTKQEWDNLLRKAGFNRYKIIPIMAIESIIIAYP